MANVMTPVRVARMLRLRPDCAHKGMLGHALLVAGSAGVGGCAVLTAESCLRSGVGKLTVCTPECNRLLMQLSVPEAVLHVPSVTDGETGMVAFSSFSPWQSVGIGPGIGLHADALLGDVLSRSGHLPLVVDADALRILARHPEWMPLLRGRAVLTPHGGEMHALAQGLLGTGSMIDGEDGLLDCAEALAREYDVWVVLKGHPTRVCQPDGKTVACGRGNAGMATAGAGDVLTGIITGLLAQGYGLAEASCMGVWLHATAGDRAAALLGQEAMLARDITSHLGEAWKELHECYVTK